MTKKGKDPENCLRALFYRWNRIVESGEGTCVEYNLQRSPVPVFTAQSLAAEDDFAEHSPKLSGVDPSSETSNSQKSPFNSINFSWWQESSFKSVTSSKYVYGPIATPIAIDMLEEVDAQFNDTKVELQNHSCKFIDKINPEHHSSNINQEGTYSSGVEFYTKDSFITSSAESPFSSSLQLTLKSPSYTVSHIKTSHIESSASPSYNPTSPSHINLNLPSNSPVSPGYSPKSPNYSPASSTSPDYSSTPTGCFPPSPVHSSSPAYSPSPLYSPISSQYEPASPTPVSPSTSSCRCSVNKTRVSKSIFSIHMNRRFQSPRRPWQTKRWRRKKIRI